LLFKRRIKGEVSLHKKFFAFLQYYKTRRYERHVLNRVGSYITVSKEDENYFKKKIQIETSSIVIENGVDIEYYKPKGLKKEEYVLIIGAQSKAATANYDATMIFMNNIWPLITESGWQGKLMIVGRNPDPSILALGYMNKNVEVIGFVEDERPFLEKAKLLLVPLRIGGGSRLKILTAFAMKTAVVSTSIGAEGIEYTNNTNIIIRDKPEDFAKATLEILNNVAYRREIENNARQLAESFYNWDIIGGKLNQFYGSLVKN
jgi:glycosyltransferase involved in cell wall biosynthesis